MDFYSANSDIHIPLPVKPIQSKKGGVTDAKLMKILKCHKSGICRFVENRKLKFQNIQKLK